MLSIKSIAEERALVLHVLVSLYCIQRYLIINYQQNLQVLDAKSNIPSKIFYSAFGKEII